MASHGFLSRFFSTFGRCLGTWAPHIEMMLSNVYKIIKQHKTVADII